jgi:hypothetical protein
VDGDVAPVIRRAPMAAKLGEVELF